MCRRRREAIESPTVLRLSAAISHVVITGFSSSPFFSFWDGLHVQHEVEVKEGCGCQRDHSAAVFTSDEEISSAAYFSWGAVD